MKRAITLAVLLLALAGGALGSAPPAPHPFSPGECAQRRARLMASTGTGLIILFGATSAQPGARFRQDNDFYYLSGIADRGAVLVLVPAQGEAHLFLPEQGGREVMVEGANLLRDAGAATRLQLTQVAGLSMLDELLARRFAKAGPVIYARLSPGDGLDSDRDEERLQDARRRRSHFNGYPGPDSSRAAALRLLFPDAQLRDVSPLLDAMRAVKGTAEIASLRRNGQLSAEAVLQAMRRTRPGASERSLEAVAVGWILDGGADGAAFQPIVASGVNACTWHYERNDGELVAGELVLMDFGADLGHLCMDISRTWPVSGVFSREQREAYQAVLEVQKATIAAIRPGMRASDIRREAGASLAARGVDAKGLSCDIHHFVGLSTHDGGPQDEPLRQGMVLTVEPGLYLPERGLGVRIEDTVLVTAAGHEVLTAAVPKEIDEIEALMSTGKAAAR